jgi:hypothetical protein
MKGFWSNLLTTVVIGFAAMATLTHADIAIEDPNIPAPVACATNAAKDGCTPETAGRICTNANGARSTCTWDDSSTGQACICP